MWKSVAICALYVGFGYLSGSVMYSYWVPKLLKNVDVREYGEDKNPGGANATVACGLPIGILCIALDIIKGTVPVACALNLSKLSSWFIVPVVAAPVIGHAWPVLFHGKGGKAIAVSFGVLIGMMPHYFLAPVLAVSILICLPFVRDHRKLILLASFVFIVATFILYSSWCIRIISLAVGGILMFKHRRKDIKWLKRKAKL